MKYLLTCILLLFLSFSFSQSEKKLLREARKALNVEKYDVAQEKYDKLLELKPNNAEYQYEAGMAYFFSSKGKASSISYFERSKENFRKDTIGETFLYLGDAYMENRQFQEALDNYLVFRSLIIDEDKSNARLIQDVEKNIMLCRNALRELFAAKNLIVTNLGPKINGPYPDFAPVISLDEKTIFYTSRRLRKDSSNISMLSPVDGRFFEDAYVSTKNEFTGEWDYPTLLNFSKPNRHEATIGVSADNQILFVYLDKQGGNIYFSDNEGEKYGELYDPGSDINTNHWETHATISVDGKTLFFVSDRPGGMGGRDIYKCVKLPNGEWSKAQNLGAPINSKYDEETPFFHPDGKTIFFSSNNEKSMGGFDIFFSQIQEDETWSDPINIGSPINTPDDDVFFSTSADGKTGYFASDREGGYGLKDLYMISLDTVFSDPITIHQGYIKVSPGEQLPPETVVWVINLTEGDEPVMYKPRLRDGGYVISLKPCVEYQIEYAVDTNVFYTTKGVVPCDADYATTQETIKIEDVTIAGIPTGKKDQLITKESPELALASSYTYQKYFGYNQKDIAQEAKDYKDFIKNVKGVIATNGFVQLSIEGSASTVPTKTYVTNENLAARRLESAKQMIVNSLVNEGVNQSKIVIKFEQSIVSGPEYKNDAYSRKSVYGKYQYIKIVAD
jgi:tetratricopeptide (TPR) repeat protein